MGKEGVVEGKKGERQSKEEEEVEGERATVKLSTRRARVMWIQFVSVARAFVMHSGKIVFMSQVIHKRRSGKAELN